MGRQTRNKTRNMLYVRRCSVPWRNRKQGMELGVRF